MRETCSIPAWKNVQTSQEAREFQPETQQKFNTLLVWKLDSMDKLQKNEKQDS